MDKEQVERRERCAQLAQTMKSLVRAHGLLNLSAIEREEIDDTLSRIARQLVTPAPKRESLARASIDDATPAEWTEACAKVLASELAWTEWRGGEPPVSLLTRVEIIRRDGRTTAGSAFAVAGWAHRQHASDIVAYRVLSD